MASGQLDDFTAQRLHKLEEVLDQKNAEIGMLHSAVAQLTDRITKLTSQDPTRLGARVTANKGPASNNDEGIALKPSYERKGRKSVGGKDGISSLKKPNPISKDADGIRAAFGSVSLMVYGPTDWASAKQDDAADATSVELNLEFAYGYNGRNGRSNLAYCGQNLVYPVGSVGVVHNRRDNAQWFFQRHSDEISCLALHPDKKVVASGQLAHGSAQPYICIWDTGSPDAPELARLTFHTKSIDAVAFASDGMRLASIGGDRDHTLAVWDWGAAVGVTEERIPPLFQAATDRDKVFGLRFGSADNLVTFGTKHAIFWDLTALGMQPPKVERARFSSRVATPKALLCGMYLDGIKCILGGDNGLLYVFDGVEASDAHKGHDSAINSICALPPSGFATGGSDSKVMIWNSAFQQTKTFSLYDSFAEHFSVQAKTGNIRSVDSVDGKIVIGTRENEIFEVDLVQQEVVALCEGHALDVTALDVHPTKCLALTGGEDKVLRLWDVRRRRLLKTKSMPRHIRSVAFHPNGEVVAVGLSAHKDGKAAKNPKDRVCIKLLHFDDLSDALSLESALPHDAVECLAFSPSAKFLAAACEDNVIQLFDAEQEYGRLKNLSGPTERIMALCFSVDDRFIAATSADGSLCFWEPKTSKRITKVASMRDVEWSEWRLTFGWSMQGAWSGEYTSVTDVTSASQSKSGSFVATGDVNGRIKLLRYPSCMRGAVAKEYGGHSAAISQMRFTVRDQHLLSLGGSDSALLQWKVAQ